MSLTKPSKGPGIIKLFPARESWVSDIPAEDVKIDKKIYSVPYPAPATLTALFLYLLPLQRFMISLDLKGV
jgi:hypothetical protein